MGGKYFTTARDDRPALFVPRMSTPIYRSLREEYIALLAQIYTHVSIPPCSPDPTSSTTSTTNAAADPTHTAQPPTAPSANTGGGNSTASSIHSPGVARTHGDLDFLVSGLKRHINTYSTDSVIASLLGAPYSGNDGRVMHFAIQRHDREALTLAVREQDRRQREGASSGSADDASTTPVLVPYLQIDVHPVRPEGWEWAVFHNSHGDLYNLLDFCVRPWGLALDDEVAGLVVRIPEVERAGLRILSEVKLTGFAREVLRFLGLDLGRYDKGFESEEQLFEWICGGTYFFRHEFREGRTQGGSALEIDELTEENNVAPRKLVVKHNPGFHKEGEESWGNTSDSNPCLGRDGSETALKLTLHVEKGPRMGNTRRPMFLRFIEWAQKNTQTVFGIRKHKGRFVTIRVNGNGDVDAANGAVDGAVYSSSSNSVTQYEGVTSSTLSRDAVFKQAVANFNVSAQVVERTNTYRLQAAEREFWDTLVPDMLPLVGKEEKSRCVCALKRWVDVSRRVPGEMTGWRAWLGGAVSSLGNRKAQGVGVGRAGPLLDMLIRSDVENPGDVNTGEISWMSKIHSNLVASAARDPEFLLLDPRTLLARPATQEALEWIRGGWRNVMSREKWMERRNAQKGQRKIEAEKLVSSFEDSAGDMSG
ncbi:MAG: hypothetical protein M1831_006714 [Alyxoria varia]|nr:MAG: hypothetical protein M1831_006714 [Alyxoria varia]